MSVRDHIFAPAFDGSDFCTHPGCRVHRVDHEVFAGERSGQRFVQARAERAYRNQRIAEAIASFKVGA